MAVRSVPASGSTSTSSRRPRRSAGKVEKAARAVLADIDTDHAAADLLCAVAERLAQDVDDAVEVRDRVAASKELREVLAALDTAVVPPRVPGMPASTATGGADAAAADDPFEIGTVPPRLDDTA